MLFLPEMPSIRAATARADELPSAAFAEREDCSPRIGVPLEGAVTWTVSDGRGPLVICPKCGGEYREGYQECAHCNIPLVEERGAAPPHRRLLDGPGGVPADVELVSVFRSSDATQLMIAESILRSAEVEFITSGDTLGEIYGLGRYPSGMSILAGPVELLVRREDAADAAAMLEDLATGDSSDEELEWSDDDLAEGEGEDS